MPKEQTGFASFPLDYLVIGLLSKGPNHGYQLYQDYKDAFGLIWVVGRSKFYAALSALQDRHLLDVTIEPQEDHPPRKVYQLTEEARAQFMEWLKQPVTPIRAIRVELIAKLRFHDLLNLPDANFLIDQQVAVCRKVLSQWQAMEASHSSRDSFDNVVFEFRVRQAQFIIEWLDSIRSQFDSVEVRNQSL